MGFLSAAKRAFSEIGEQAGNVVNEAIPGGGPIGGLHPKPKPQKEVPWWLDTDIYDLATRKYGIPTGPYRIKLRNGQPVGGVELAPDYQRGGRLHGTQFNPGRPVVTEDMVVEKFRQLEGRNPTDDELVMLMVAAGHKPDRRIRGTGAQARDERGAVIRDLSLGEEVGLDSEWAKSDFKAQLPLRHNLSFDESDINQAKVGEGYRHLSAWQRVEESAKTFADTLPFLGSSEDEAKLREEHGFQGAVARQAFRQIMAGLGLAGEAQQFAAENVGGGITMFPADAARAAGQEEFAQQLEHPVTRGAVGNTALLLSGLPIISITNPSGVLRGARFAGLAGRISAATVRGGRAAGERVVAEEVAKNEIKLQRAVDDFVLKKYEKETGIKLHKYPRSEKGALALEKQADTLTETAGRIRDPERALKLQQQASKYRDASNLIRAVMEEEIPLSPQVIEASDFVRRTEGRRPTGLISTVYHGTVEANAPAIEASGLAKGSWVTEDRDIALLHAVNRELGGVRALAKSMKISLKGKTNEQLLEEIKAASGGEIPGIKVYEVTAPAESFTGKGIEGVSTTKRALMPGENAAPKLLGRTARSNAQRIAQMNGINWQGMSDDDLLAALKAASAHVPEALTDRGLPAYSDIPIYQYVGLIQRAKELPRVIGQAEEIVRLARARGAARRLAKQEAALGQNARRVGEFLSKLEQLPDGTVTTPALEEVREIAKLANISDKTIAGKSADDLTSLIIERWADLQQFATKTPDGPGFAEVVNAIRHLPRADATDILRSLRWHIPGHTELGYIEQLPGREVATRVVGEAAEAVEPRAIPTRLARFLESLGAHSTTTQERHVWIRTAENSGYLDRAVQEALENGMPTLEANLSREEVVAKVEAFANALKRGAPAETAATAQSAEVVARPLIVRLAPSGRLVELPAAAATTMRSVFSGTTLANEVKGAVGRVDEARKLVLAKAAKGVSLPTLERIVKEQQALRSRVSKSTINEARAIVKENSPQRKELREVVGKLQDIERHNVEIAKRVAEATYLREDPALAQAVSKDKVAEILAARESKDRAEFVRILESKRITPAEGRALTPRQEAVNEAIDRLINPAEILQLSDDARVADILNQSSELSRSELARLLVNTEAHNLGRGGDVGMFSQTPLGPLVRLVTGRFTNNPLVMGVFWAHEMAANTGGLTNGAFISKTFQLAEDLVPVEVRAGLPKDPAERLGAFLRSKWLPKNEKEARAALGLSRSSYADEAFELLKGELATYLNFPEFYGNMPDAYKDLAKASALFDQNYNDVSAAWGIQADALREASRESIITDKVGNWLRQIPDDASLRRGVGATWEHLARAIDTDPRLVGRGYSLKKLTKHGRDLLVDFNNARFRHIVQRRTAESIANLSTGSRAAVFYTGLPDDVVRANKDMATKKAKAAVSYINGKWGISSHELWAPEIRPWLNGLADVLSGSRGVGGPLGFVQDLFRTLMMGRLVLDASILGIQGSFYASARTFMKPGRGLVGLDAMPNLAYESLKMTNTNYFTNWMWQNLPELRSYFNAGLSTGVEGLVGTSAAGARRMLLVEQFPTLLGRIQGPVGKAGRIATAPLGKGGELVRGLNDVMFDRWLLYMKVNVIRQHLDTVQMFRTAFRQPNLRKVAEDLVNTEGTGINLVARELGRNDLLWLGTKDDTLQAVVRVVNNQLGGLTRAQLGRTMWRETAEQLLLMVPGFWRARLGLLTSAISRPNSIEGSLAMGQVFREYAFFGAWATMISMMTGNMDKLNLHDPRRADWLAGQFGDFYVPMMPSSASSYRLMARLVAGINDPKNPEERLSAVRVMLEGRLHPALQAVYEHINREDFLGNRLDTKEAQFLNYAQMLQPIFTEQMGGIVAAQTEGEEVNTEAIATQGLAAFMGKNIIPINPIEHLDEYASKVADAEGRTGRRWFELGNHERAVARIENPEVETWEMEWEETQVGKRDPLEQRVDAIFDRFPIIRAETKESLEKLGDQLDVGAIDDKDFRQQYRLAQVGQAQRFEELEELMRINGRDPEEAFRKKREEKDKVGLVDQAILDYNNVDFDQFVHEEKVTTEFGEATVEKIDYEGWDAAREAALAPYDLDVRNEAIEFIRREEPKIKTRYREAQNDLDHYFSIPKYKGFSVQEGAFIDSVSRYFTVAAEKMRVLASEKGVEAPSGSRLRLLVLRSMIESGQIKTRREAQMAALAGIMARQPSVKKKVLNPERPAWVIQHPDLPLFYRFVANDVPDELKDRLNPVALGPTSFEGILEESEAYAK